MWCVVPCFQHYSRFISEPLITTAVRCTRRHWDSQHLSGKRMAAASALVTILRLIGVKCGISRRLWDKKKPRPSIIAAAPKQIQTTLSGRRKMKGDTNKLENAAGSLNKTVWTTKKNHDNHEVMSLICTMQRLIFSLHQPGVKPTAFTLQEHIVRKSSWAEKPWKLAGVMS